MTVIAGCYYLLSAGISFTISVIINYILSVKYVFDINSEYSKKRNFILFIIFSIIDLLLTEVIMKIDVDYMYWNYMLVKIFATIVVMVYNFVSRKIFLE